MYRKIYEKLLEWKNSDDKKPLMLLGARQVGKTYIIEEFCKNEFSKFKKILITLHISTDICTRYIL